MAANTDVLYETDFYAWTRHQAEELRRLKELRLNVELDLDRVAEEIEDLGTSSATPAAARWSGSSSTS